MLLNTKSPVTHHPYRRALKQKIAASQKKIRETIEAHHAKVIHRTQALNRKRPYQTMDEEITAREKVIAEQIKAWRSILPQLILKFSRIPFPDAPKV
jgi:hypothetical protein